MLKAYGFNPLDSDIKTMTAGTYPKYMVGPRARHGGVRMAQLPGMRHGFVIKRTPMPLERCLALQERDDEQPNEPADAPRKNRQ